MALPLKYSFRNLWVRRVTTLMTTFGVALTVVIFAALMALSEGIHRAMVTAGLPENVILMRDGATATEFSGITRDKTPLVKALAEIETTVEGESLASPEYHLSYFLPSPKDTRRFSTRFRAMTPIAFKLYPQVRLVEGDATLVGNRLLLGRAVATRLGYRLGDQIRFGRSTWTVAGIFEAGGTSIDSEVWADLEEVLDDQQRKEISCYIVKLRDPSTLAPFKEKVDADPQLGLKAVGEVEYYEEQASNARQIRRIGLVISCLMAVGAVFGGMNTMYAAVSGRTQEVGMLRTLGFTRSQILSSLLVEGILICLMGGVAGGLISFSFNAISLTLMSTNFTDLTFRFQVTPLIFAQGIFFSILIGIVGSFLPARAAARLEVISALRTTQ